MEAEEEKPAEEPVEEPTEEMPAEEEVKEEPVEEKPEEVEEKEEETPAEEEETEERNNTNINKSNIRKMEKKFSLVKELRNAMETGKSVNLNEIAKRAYTVADNGEAVVETDIYDILEPLRAKNVLVSAGAKFMTGLQGNVQVPVMSATQVGWKGETATAEDGSGAFASVTLSPKRLTGKFPVSLELLAQDTLGVENMIRQDIVNAINEKLEATILGTGAGDMNTPAGLFNGYADENAIADFGDIADLEAVVEEKNVYGNCKYIVSPKAKATLRSTIKGTANVGMILENGAIDGTEALATSNVPAGKMLYGDFSNLVIGQWDSVILDVVRDTESLANGCVTIVVNAYFDAKVAREGAIVAAHV
jgi:HK97 family phage major capsid protein